MPDTGGAASGSKVSDPQHSQKLLRVLRSFWQEQCFHDALLVVDGEELPVQKNILAAASPYIRSKNMAELYFVLAVLYTAVSHTNPDVIMDLLTLMFTLLVSTMWMCPAISFFFSSVRVICKSSFSAAGCHVVISRPYRI